MTYTQDQTKDLMHLRQLFYSKVGQLCRERKALLCQMADEQDVGANIGLDDVSVRLSEVSDLAEQLRANGADEYRTYMQFSSAFSRGVCCFLIRSTCSSMCDVYQHCILNTSMYSGCKLVACVTPYYAAFTSFSMYPHLFVGVFTCGRCCLLLVARCCALTTKLLASCGKLLVSY